MEILDARSPARPAGDAAVAALFRARYAEMVRLAGRIWRGDGLPYGLWEVNYPAADSAVIVFRNAAGRVVATLYG
jgi:hypothetical protein